MEKAAPPSKGSSRRVLIGIAALLWTVWANGSPAGGAGDAAPELTGKYWLNSAPLTIVGLKRHVVLLEFWTYG